MAAAITLVFLISLILSAVAQAERAHCKGEAGGHKFYYVILFNCKQYTNAPPLPSNSRGMEKNFDPRGESPLRSKKFGHGLVSPLKRIIQKKWPTSPNEMK